MPVNFSPERWEKIKRNYTLWWEKKLERPLIPIVLTGNTTAVAKPSNGLLSQKNCNDFSVTPKQIIDAIDYEFSTYEFLGDAFPVFSLDCFGPGIVAAFMGAELDNSTGSVWFHPKEIIPISDLHFEYDANNIWLNRIKEICEEGVKRWQGQMIFSMPDLGGVFDILATFRSTENLLTDLYDEPDEVKRLCWELHSLWHRYYHEISVVIKAADYGFSDWSQTFSTKPSYVLQSDFSYMISPGMFDEFVRPELEQNCIKLDNTMYHLDGIGQLNHLDSVLGISKLGAVQWVPGEGKPDPTHWPEVQKKIIASGKNIQIYGDPYNGIQRVSEHLGSARGIHHMSIRKPAEEKKQCLELLSRFGV